MEQNRAVFLDDIEEELKKQILELVETYLYSETKISDNELSKKIFELVRRNYDI
jgi:hypothetical protein